MGKQYFTLEELLSIMEFGTITFNKEETAKRLEQLRISNEELHKYVCRHSRLWKNKNMKQRKSKKNFDECPNNYDCKNCSVAQSDDIEEDVPFDKAYANISRESLGRSFGRQKSEIDNLERGTKGVTLDKIMCYAYIAKVPLSDILVLDGDFCFENGIIVRKGNPEYQLSEN